MAEASTNDASNCATVFGFNCLRMYPPCWSCKGHKYPDGSILRVLQGRFSTRAHVYPRLIGDWLTRSWRMSVSDSGRTVDRDFGIEPDSKMATGVRLDKLQRDG